MFQRIIDNAHKAKEKRNLGELTPSISELQNTEYRVIHEAEMEAFSEEMEALERKKHVSKKSLVLVLTPMLADGLLRSNIPLEILTHLKHKALPLSSFTKYFQQKVKA